MTTTQDHQHVSTLELLIAQAWRDLQQARRDDDRQTTARAERRMNALLDRLSR